MRTIRPMTQEDISSVLKIENQVFTNPWPEEAFEYHEHTEFFVICEDEVLVGFIIYHNVLDESVIINLAVDPAYQRKGYGEALLKQTLEQLEARKFKHFFLDVRESNLAARKLYEKYGFRRLGTRKQYYTKPDEDGILMVKTT